MIFTDNEALEELKKRSETTDKFIIDAREMYHTRKAIIDGTGFHKLLIEKIEHIESEERKSARKKYAKDIRDIYPRLFSKRDNVFDATGGSVINSIKSDNITNQLNEILDNFKGNKSKDKYLREVYFKQADIDPNGLIMLEYKNDVKKPYPAYKSIIDIRYYESNGQKLEYLVFEPIQDPEDENKKYWRFVDDQKDRTFMQIKDTFQIIQDLTFTHPFGDVPALILSNKEIIGTKLRESSIDVVLKLLEDYARDKSVLTIYKFTKGFPVHYMYGDIKCNMCNGKGKDNKGNTCKACNGTGKKPKPDVTDKHIIPIPKEGQPFLGDKVSNFSSPDLDTWSKYKEDLQDLENIASDTIWGTERSKKSEKKNETATRVYFDLEPINTVLSCYTDTIEYVDNTLTNWIVNFIDQYKDKKEHVYNKSYGRNYIILGATVLTEEYHKSKEAGDNNTILDKLLNEIILSTYKGNSYMQDLMLKKAKLEPYKHLSIKEVYDIFGATEANKKIIFSDFWDNANQDKDYDELKKELEIFYSKNKLEIEESGE